MTKKNKSVTILLLMSMIISIISINVIGVRASSITISPPTISDDTEYLVLYDRLRTYINEIVEKDTSKDALLNYLKDANFEKAIAQREFIRRAGTSTLENFSSTDEKKNFIHWILNSTEAMNLFLEGGEPNSEYSKAFNIWFEIFTKDTDSHTGYELRLAIAAAMRFGNGVSKWYTKRTLVTPYERYEYYKVREAEGVFPISMKTRTIWELRNTIAAPCSNWDLDFTRDVRHKGRYNEKTQKVGLRYPRYSMYSTRLKPNGQPYGIMASSDNFFGPDATLKEVYEIGGVCGTASKLGSITNNAFGIPAFNIGQPRHAAFLYHMPTTEGKWQIGNNAAGWGRSVVGYRTLIPYTNYSNISSNRPAYWFVYEESRKDEEALHRSHQLKWIANALKDYDKSQAVRKVAIDINEFNIDVWQDSISEMKNALNNAVEKRKIPLDKMKVASTSSHSSSLRASLVLDGDRETIWHTKYGKDKVELPQSITLSFDEEYEINKFKYLPRNNGKDGIITEYKLYTSIDGENYELVSSGRWSDNSSTKVVDFETKKAKHIKLVAIKGVKGYASAAELRVYRPLLEKPVTIEERIELVDSLMDKLNEHPRVVFDLFKVMKSLIVDEVPREKYQEYIITLTSIIKNAKNINYKQGQAARVIGESLVSEGFVLADFNFNGEKKGRLVGSKTDTEYSLDGGKTWKPITVENMRLSSEELSSITAENNIRLRIIGTDDYVTISIQSAPSLPRIHANDDTNKIFGLNDITYYSIDEGKTWSRYKNQASLPDLSGDLKFMVKIPATGKTMESEVRTCNFSSKVNPLVVLPSDIKNITTNARKFSSIGSIYDGNNNSYFSTNYSDTGQKLPHSVTLELKEPSNINKLEYVPRQGGKAFARVNAYRIYTSRDGKNFTLVTEGNDWSSYSFTKRAEFNSREVKYLKFEAVKAERNFITIGELRLYKTDKLTPDIKFDFDNSDTGILLGSTPDMEYSVDNGITWKDVTKLDMKLTAEDYKKISQSSVINVRYKNTTEVSEIKITVYDNIPEIKANDDKNTITGLDDTMEYGTDGETWINYNGTLKVDLRGNVDLYVRYKATGTNFAGDHVILKYTADEMNEFDERVDYKFISKGTGKSIYVEGNSSSDNKQIIQYKYKSWENQMVNLVPVSENQYKIVLKRSGKVLYPRSSDDGEILVQTTYTGRDAEKWEFVHLGNNEYEIINVESGLAITAHEGGYRVTDSKLNHSKNQVWKLDYVQSAVVPEVSFSLNGENAQKIMGSRKSMEYTIDGGETWKPITRDNMPLYTYQINALNSEDGIRVRIKGNAGIAYIEIKKPLDISELNEVIKEGESLVEFDYEKESWETLQVKLNMAKALITIEETDQIQVDKTAEEILTTISNLIRFKGESPIINASNITIYRSNGMNFDEILSNVIATDKEDGDISSKITYTTNYIKDQIGEFEIEYNVIDSHGNETTKKVKLEVLEKEPEEPEEPQEQDETEKFVYASDLDWEKATTSRRSVQRDKSIHYGIMRLWDGEKEVRYEKGIGTHAYSEVIYDLEGKGYKYFTSDIGVNRTATDKGAIKFKVYVDSKLTYASEIMRRDTPLETIKINVEGANIIRLVVIDGGNGVANDHADWADAKFLMVDDITTDNNFKEEAMEEEFEVIEDDEIKADEEIKEDEVIEDDTEIKEDEEIIEGEETKEDKEIIENEVIKEDTEIKEDKVINEVEETKGDEAIKKDEEIEEGADVEKIEVIN